VKSFRGTKLPPRGNVGFQEVFGRKDSVPHGTIFFERKEQRKKEVANHSVLCRLFLSPLWLKKKIVLNSTPGTPDFVNTRRRIPKITRDSKMVIAEAKSGDVTQATEPYIAQQSNCTTCFPNERSIGGQIARAYPYADIYRRRTPQTRNIATPSTRDKPGTIAICEPETEDQQPHIVHLLAQWAPGPVNGKYVRLIYPSYGEIEETAGQREQWFKKALNQLDELIPADARVAVPFYIGCGRGGGNWDHYYKMLRDARTQFVLYNLV
jgi:hypothetical protein